MEATRFFIVTVLGLALDLAVAWSAAFFFRLPLWVAAAVGFSIASIVNYALHELWTFRAASGHLSGSRAIRYSFALAAALAIRIGSVSALASAFVNIPDLLVLIAGAGISFCIHFLISKHFVFARPQV